MNSSIHTASSSEQFNAVCTQIGHFGEEGYERIQITRNQLGAIPVAIPSSSWIERVLRFFGFKKRDLQLTEVANFSLNWLRAHALDHKYHTDFHEQLPQIEKLRPLMQKAHLEEDFNALISSTEQIQKICESIGQRFESQISTLLDPANDAVKRSMDSCNQAQNLWKALEQRRAALDIKEPTIADFQFHLPHDIPGSDEIEIKIKDILSKFLSRPGTTIARLKKTTTVILNVPTEGSISYELPMKADFYLEGAISQRRIVLKTKEVIGSGGERKVLRAFDLLSGEELVSKPFVNGIEKLIVENAHKNQLTGFVPFIGQRNQTRFYEKKCETLTSYLKADPSIRYKLIFQLLSALKNLHSHNISDFSYTIKTEKGAETKKIGIVNIYHGDIKAENILVFSDKNNIPQAALSDLGTLCNVVTPCYTVLFRSPEKTRFIEEKCYFFNEPSPFIKTEDIITHHRTYGQSNDVWSLGLVLITILSEGCVLPGSNLKDGIPNLNCFKKGLDDHQKAQKQQQRPIMPNQRATPADFFVKDLNQKDIDQSIDLLVSECNPPEELKLVWRLAKCMLQVDPSRRITAARAIEMLKT